MDEEQFIIHYGKDCENNFAYLKNEFKSSILEDTTLALNIKYNLLSNYYDWIITNYKNEMEADFEFEIFFYK